MSCGIDLCNKCFEENGFCIEGLDDMHLPDDIYKSCREYKFILTLKQLEKAEEVIRFYGDKNSWLDRWKMVIDDFSTEDTYGKGGKRARNYFKQKEGGK